MTENTQIKIFEEKKVRTLWDKEKEGYSQNQLQFFA